MAYFDRNSGRNRRNPREPQPAHRPSVMGMLFNPSVGMSFNAVRETGRMFVHLIALIFAQANLIDRRHPAVLGKPGEQYGLFDVIQLAYQRVEWRQENFMQCAMFVAVVSCIAVCAISVVYAVFVAFIGL